MSANDIHSNTVFNREKLKVISLSIGREWTGVGGWAVVYERCGVVKRNYISVCDNMDKTQHTTTG